VTSPTTPVQSSTTSTEIVATAPEIGLSSGDVSGPVVAANSAGAGVEGVATDGAGSDTAGIGNDGTGTLNGTGIGGTGTGTGNGKGPGSASGSSSGNGDGTGNAPTGGNGLPFGLASGIGNTATKHIVYILDASPSMAAKIKMASGEIISAMKQLKSGDSFDVIMFGDNVNVFKNGLVSFNEEVQKEAAGFMNIPAHEKGGTNLEEAVSAALNIPGTTEIVVVTDGVPTEGETGAYKLAHNIKTRNTHHARIYAVGLMDTLLDDPDDTATAKALLTVLASENGGTSRMLDVAKW
jgi:hypothetical protein